MVEASLELSPTLVQLVKSDSIAIQLEDFPGKDRAGYGRFCSETQDNDSPLLPVKSFLEG